MQTRRAVLARGAPATVVVALALMMMSAMTASAATPTKRLLITSAGWHGRAIQEPHRHDAVRTATGDRALRGWSAGAVSLGTGLHRASGSQRVREVQWRLRALGYRPGPIDGIFGPLTRAAVGWFQYKHGFPISGRATLAMVRHLRARTSPSGSRGQAQAEPGGLSSASVEPLRRLVVAPPKGAEAGGTHQVGWMSGSALAVLALLFGAAAGLAGATLAPRRVAPRDDAGSATQPRARAAAYVRMAAGERSGDRFQSHAAAVEAACGERGIELCGFVSDDERDGRPIEERPGLAYAVGQLDAGEIDCLVVDRLDDLSRSVRDIRKLLTAMTQRGAPLVILNLESDRTVATSRWATGSQPDRPYVPSTAQPPNPLERSDA